MILVRQMKDRPSMSIEESIQVGERMKKPKGPHHFDIYLLICAGVVYVTLAFFVLDRIVST